MLLLLNEPDANSQPSAASDERYNEISADFKPAPSSTIPAVRTLDYWRKQVSQPRLRRSKRMARTQSLSLNFRPECAYHLLSRDILFPTIVSCLSLTPVISRFTTHQSKEVLIELYESNAAQLSSQGTNYTSSTRLR